MHPGLLLAPRHMRACSLVIAAAFSLAAAPRLGAQRPTAGEQPAVIGDSVLVQRLRQHAERLARGDQFSGVILLSQAGRPVFEAAYGYADREARRPNTTGTAFNYSSIGKLFTQAAVWQLIHAGKLAPDSTVGHYWSEYPNADVARTVTVRQLLQHRSGVGGDVFGTPVGGTRRDVRSTRDYVALIANAPMHFAAGTQQEYSNAGYIILGALVERVSGEDFYTYVRRHILEPAGLHSTAYYASDSLPGTAAIGYTRIAGGDDAPNPAAPWRRNSAGLPGRGSAAGGGYSTVEDLARFVAALRGARIDGFAEVRHGAVAGGSPGSNGIIEEDLPGGYDLVVLSNFDPPAATAIASTVRNWLLGRADDAPDPRRPLGAVPALDLAHTAAGRAADRYLRAFNTGDTTAVRALIEHDMVPNPARTIAQRLDAYRTMHDDLGTLTAFSSTMSGADGIAVVAHAEKGGDVALLVSVEHAAPNRIASVRFERH